MNFQPRNRPLRSYYVLWLLENDEIRREIEQRSILRKMFKPMAICETEFINRYRLNKAAFQYLCNMLKEYTTLKSSKRVSLEHMVSCALSFYASGSHQRIVGMAKHLGQTTVSKYVREITTALNDEKIVSKLIRLPTNRAERDLIRQKFYTQFGFPGVLGCIGGSHFHICSPEKATEHLYFCRKKYHSLNVQLICDADGRILNLNAKYGGANHDAFIWENSEADRFMQSLQQNNEHTWLLGDSGYPLKPWLMTPIPDAVESSPEAKYTSIHDKTRALIDNTFGHLKNRWRCISNDRTVRYKPDKCTKIITACSVLHNLACNFNVPDPDFEGEPTLTTEEFMSPMVPVESRPDESELLLKGEVMRSQLVEMLNNQ